MLIESIVRKTLGLKRHCVERVKDENGPLAVYLSPDKRYKLVCSACHGKASGYDTLSERRWKHVPLWGIPVQLVLGRWKLISLRVGPLSFELLSSSVFPLSRLSPEIYRVAKADARSLARRSLSA